ncbi:MAG: DUF2189 domain-containing protein [Sandaracinobacter sp.]
MIAHSAELSHLVGMDSAEQVQLAPVTVAANLQLADLGAALSAGWQDFRSMPAYGIFFAAVYVAASLALAFAVFELGQPQWLAVAVAGFPLLGPFTAVGLYEASRRREAGLPVSWGAVLGAVRSRGDDQILMIGFILFLGFGLWLFIAHGISAIFLSNVIGPTTLALFRQGAGLAMLIFGSAVGALFALAFFSLTVISLPLLVDRKVDFITAIIVSLGTVRSNTAVMLAWAVIVAVLLFLAMLPLFLGLFLVLPVLGHATWHLYRRAVPWAENAHM